MTEEEVFEFAPTVLQKIKHALPIGLIDKTQYDFPFPDNANFICIEYMEFDSPARVDVDGRKFSFVFIYENIFNEPIGVVKNYRVY